MPGFLLFGLLALLLAALVHALWLRRRHASLAAEAAALQDAAAARDRSFGLLAREMQSLGLRLLGHAGGGRDSAAAAASIAEGARRLLDLSDELTELLALRHGLRVVHAQPIRLLPVLEEAVATTAAQLGASRRDWQLAPECGAIALSADARAMRGVLEQVLARAARMTRDGDWIGIRAVITPDMVAILVEDEGLGLGAADVAPEAPAGAGTRGLGFGLAVARALLEAHGGSLRIEALQGVGARAWLTLPRERLIPT